MAKGTGSEIRADTKRVCPFRTANKILLLLQKEGELVNAGEEQYFPECYEERCPLWKYEFGNGYHCLNTDYLGGDVNEL